MSSTVTALPRSGWWSWRLTPRIQIGCPLTNKSPSRDLDAAEPDHLGVDLGHDPAGIEQFGDDPVPGRPLGRPRIDVGSSNRLDAT